MQTSKRKRIDRHSRVIVRLLLGLVGSLALSGMVDALGLQRDIKAVLAWTMLVWTMSVGVFVYLVYYAPFPTGADDTSSVWAIGASNAAVNFLTGAVSPLAFELVAEVTFPVSEETAAAYMTLMLSVFNLALMEGANALDGTNPCACRTVGSLRGGWVGGVCVRTRLWLAGRRWASGWHECGGRVPKHMHTHTRARAPTPQGSVHTQPGGWGCTLLLILRQARRQVWRGCRSTVCKVTTTRRRSPAGHTASRGAAT